MKEEEEGGRERIHSNVHVHVLKRSLELIITIIIITVQRVTMIIITNHIIIIIITEVMCTL